MWSGPSEHVKLAVDSECFELWWPDWEERPFTGSSLMAPFEWVQKQ